MDYLWIVICTWRYYQLHTPLRSSTTAHLSEVHTYAALWTVCHDRGDATALGTGKVAVWKIMSMSCITNGLISCHETRCECHNEIRTNYFCSNGIRIIINAEVQGWTSLELSKEFLVQSRSVDKGILSTAFLPYSDFRGRLMAWNELIFRARHLMIPHAVWKEASLWFCFTCEGCTSWASETDNCSNMAEQVS